MLKRSGEPSGKSFAPFRNCVGAVDDLEQELSEGRASFPKKKRLLVCLGFAGLLLVAAMVVVVTVYLSLNGDTFIIFPTTPPPPTNTDVPTSSFPAATSSYGASGTALVIWFLGILILLLIQQAFASADTSVFSPVYGTYY
jgi:hypothetical protein